MVKQELQAEAVRLLVLLRAMYASRAQHHRVVTTARCTRCDGSLPLPLHLAIKRNGFQMMFPPAATWTRAVGLRGQEGSISIYALINVHKYHCIVIYMRYWLLDNY